MWGRGSRGNNATCSAPIPLSIISPTTHKQIGPFWCWFPGEWFCIHSRTLWVSPVNFSVRLGVSSTATIPKDFYSQRFWRLSFPMCKHWVVYSVSQANVGPPRSVAATPLAQSSSCCLAAHPLCPSCPSPPLLPVWMNISSLTPWLLDFCTVLVIFCF